MRGLRCGVFALVTTALAALAHATAGSMLPSPWLLLLAAVGIGVAAAPLTRRERPLAVVVAATLTSQLVLHVLLTLEMTPGCLPGSSAGAGDIRGMAGMTGRGTAAGCGRGSWLPAAAGDRHGVVMIAGHVAAALVLAWWLRRGERAAARLALLVGRTLGRAGRRLVGPAPDPCGPRVPVLAGPRPGRRAAVRHPGLRGAQVRARRGPPAAARTVPAPTAPALTRRA